MEEEEKGYIHSSNKPRGRGVGGGKGAGTEGAFGVGCTSGFGFQVAQAGSGLASGGGGGAATGAGRDLGSFLCAMAFLLTVRHAGFAGPAATSSSGGGTASGAGGSGSFGFQSGAYSPPAPCFDFTAMSSAISNCNARRSSLSFPTSCSRIRTSDASALLKSFKYLGGAPL